MNNDPDYHLLFPDSEDDMENNNRRNQNNLINVNYHNYDNYDTHDHHHVLTARGNHKYNYNRNISNNNSNINCNNNSNNNNNFNINNRKNNVNISASVIGTFRKSVFKPQTNIEQVMNNIQSSSNLVHPYLNQLNQQLLAQKQGQIAVETGSEYSGDDKLSVLCVLFEFHSKALERDV